MLHLTDYQPHRRLALQWRGPAPTWVLAKWPATLAVVVIWVYATYEQIAWIRVTDWHRAIGSTFFVLLVAGLLPFAFLLVFGRWTALEVDRGQGTIEGRQDDWIAFIPRRRRIRIDELRRVDVETGRAFSGIAIVRLRLRFKNRPPDSRPLEISLRIEGMDTHEKVKDLVERLGRVMGWRGQRLIWESPEKLQMELLEEADPEHGVMPIESGEKPWPLDRRWPRSPPPAKDVSAAVQEPQSADADAAAEQIRVGPFNPERFEFDGYVRRVIDWRPGRQIRIYRPPIPPWRVGLHWVFFTFMGAVLSIGVLAWTGLIFIGFWLVPIGSIVFGWFCVSAIKEMHGERAVILDWQRGEASFSDGKKLVRVPLQAIEQILVRIERDRDLTKHSSTYSCEVQAVLPEGPQRIAKTRECTERMEAVRMAAPMAASLSDSLGVAWHLVERRLVQTRKG